MARPPLKLERQKIILQAFTECIAENGLNATTLDDIALKSQNAPQSSSPQCGESYRVN